MGQRAPSQRSAVGSVPPRHRLQGLMELATCTQLPCLVTSQTGGPRAMVRPSPGQGRFFSAQGALLSSHPPFKLSCPGSLASLLHLEPALGHHLHLFAGTVCCFLCKRTGLTFSPSPGQEPPQRTAAYEGGSSQGIPQTQAFATSSCCSLNKGRVSRLCEGVCENMPGVAAALGGGGWERLIPAR